ncbi:hypothetical protein CBER1_11209 [Cercospora berteroae]|uniref:Aminotransferase class I/classII large domain-containing protein n=1 Tax=Cercospora berteroae TaxID=357750 RepID=A0A2S6CMG6_9PEZI|nr:hypothetical protein CBER1_11209 [Cercospora berteroae]
MTMEREFEIGLSQIHARDHTRAAEITFKDQGLLSETAKGQVGQLAETYGCRNLDEVEPPRFITDDKTGARALARFWIETTSQQSVKNYGSFIMSTAEKYVQQWMQSQKPQAAAMKTAPAFYRNLEEALDARRQMHAMFTRVKSTWKTGDSIDFCSNDLLSLGTSGRAREEFLAELSNHPDFVLYAGGTRVVDGNYDYIEQVEQEIADFHGAQAAILVNSGWEGNMAIYTGIPRPGDAIVYDELVHASTHDGMEKSLALVKRSFRHNDVDSFRETMISVLESSPVLKDGSRTILISVESVYSMDGDVCPLQALLEVATEVVPKGNFEFIVDEAHATGIIGPRGAGLVNKLGLEKQIAIRLHTCGKALACNGALILCNETVRHALINFARCLIYTTAPSFAVVAAVRAEYRLLISGQSLPLQANVQHLVKLFLSKMAALDVWERASEMGILSIPVADDEWEAEDHEVTHIVALWTRQRYNWFLVFHLQLNGIAAFPVDYPTVPKGQGRIRLMFHAKNTEAHVEYLVATIGNWAKEMVEIENSGGDKSKVPRAAQRAFEMMNVAA